MRIAAHQANFIPWFPFFYKMAMVDKFIILRHVQFEKNNYQNRYRVSSGKWVTKSVNSGIDTIVHKSYVDGNSLYGLNIKWIEVMKDTLGIETELVSDYPTDLRGTDRLVDLVEFYEGNVYVTNPEAKHKYLDEGVMRSNFIDIEYCKVPTHLNKHTFEIFEEYGIDGAIKQLPKRKMSEKSQTVLQLS